MTTSARGQRPVIGEVWMILQDRKRLARLMVIQGVTQRELAEAAGWTAHSIVTRLLAGKVKTVTPERAVRIAHHLHVGVEDLFLTRVDSVTGGTDHRSGRAA